MTQSPVCPDEGIPLIAIIEKFAQTTAHSIGDVRGCP